MNIATKRTFNAITGRELLEIILKDLREQWEADDNFGEAVTYPICEYVVDGVIKAYPRTPPSFKVEAEGGIVEHKKTKEGEVPAFKTSELNEPVEISAHAENIIDNANPPDKAREDAGLPVSMPEQSSTYRGIVVDKSKIRPRGQQRSVATED